MPENSPAQLSYLHRKKRENTIVVLLRILLFAGFLVLWEISSKKGWIDSFIFSSPSLIAAAFKNMLLTQELLSHIGITLAETLLSFFFVVILGLTTAILLWIFPKAARVLEPYLVVLNSLPKSALAPLLIVWLGASQRTIVVAGISVALFGSVINLYTGFSGADPEKLKLIRTLGGKKKEELTKIVLPSSVPLILSTMKVNIGLCLVGVIIGEFIGARKGLGYLIIYGSQTFLLAGIRILYDMAVIQNKYTIMFPVFPLNAQTSLPWQQPLKYPQYLHRNPQLLYIHCHLPRKLCRLCLQWIRFCRPHL